MSSAKRARWRVWVVMSSRFCFQLPAQLRLRRPPARVGTALKTPIELDGYALEVSASIGLSLALSADDDADTLLRRADVAMYVAKRSGMDSATYAPEQEQNTPDTLALIGELRRAIERSELRLN